MPTPPDCDCPRCRTEEGRRLASEREDLIAAGVDPADLVVPLAPAAGEHIRAGQFIGRAGGGSTGPHIHIELSPSDEDALPGSGPMVWLWRIDNTIARVFSLAWTRVINTVRRNR